MLMVMILNICQKNEHYNYETHCLAKTPQGHLTLSFFTWKESFQVAEYVKWIPLINEKRQDLVLIFAYLPGSSVIFSKSGFTAFN